MSRHTIEKALMALFLAISLGFATYGKWSPAQYWLFMAAFVDFDDWSRGPNGPKQ